ncbi:hypothetical protein FQN49_004668 [Arthroderma sp. PD_2]|nr:hypothetical protein FQN49_004668 [Arthroderma sp. PD_2]
MAQRDMRRADLVVPYEAPPVKKADGDISGTIASTMPMAAMFTRNRLIGWYVLTNVGISTRLPSILERNSEFLILPVSIYRPELRVLVVSSLLISFRSSLVFTLQAWLAESPDQKKASSTPAYMSVFMSAMAVVVTYMPLFLPPPQSGNKAPPVPAS